MRLRTIEIEQMGPYQTRMLTFERLGLHVVYGKNEAGKSTLLAAIRGILFGMPFLADGTLHGRPGAFVRSSLEHENGELTTLDRGLAKKSQPRLQLYTGEAMTGQDALVRTFPELSGIEHTLFETFFTIQLADLVAFSERPLEIANQVFGVRAPLLNPYQFERDLERKARDVYNPSPRASRPRLNRLLKEYKQTRHLLQECRDSEPWYEEMSRRRLALKLRLEEQQQKETQLVQNRLMLERLIACYGDVQRLFELERELRMLGACPVGDLETWIQAEMHLQKVDELRQQQIELTRDGDEIEVDMHSLESSKPWLAVRPVLGRLQSEIHQACEVVVNCEVNSEEKARGLYALQAIKSLPSTWTEHQVSAAATKDDSWMNLLELTKKFEDQSSVVEGLELQVATNQRLANEHRERFQRSAAWQVQRPDEAMAKLQFEKTEQNRQYNEILQDLKTLRHAEEKHGSSLSNNARFRGQSAILFGVAIALMLGAVFDGMHGSRYSSFLFVAASLTMFIYAFTSRSSVSRQHKRQQGRGKPSRVGQLHHAAEVLEADEVMQERLTRRVEEIQRRLQSLMEIEQLVLSWQQSDRQLQGRVAECDEAAERQRTYFATMQAELHHWGLSSHVWKRRELEELSDCARTQIEAKMLIENAHREMTINVSKLEALAQRIARTIEIHKDTLGIEGHELVQLVLERLAAGSDIQSPLVRLRQLADTWTDVVSEAERHHDEWMALFHRRERCQLDMDKLDTEILKLEGQFGTIFDMLRVTTKEEYHAVISHERQRRIVHDELNEVIHRLILACGGEQAASRVVETVKSSTLIILKQQEEQIVQDLQQVTEGIESIRKQVWEAEQAMEQSVVETEGRRLRFELARLEATIEEAKEDYLSLLLTRSVSKWAREHVESRNVSPVLQFASAYLAEMTNQRYTEIRIPIGDDGMQGMHVRDQLGHNWGLETLSRGTREQVYLALRLATVRDYREKGVILPVILDDPLVNFDDDRARNVFHLLRREAVHQPIVYLTCHNRLLDELEEMSDIRMLHLDA